MRAVGTSRSSPEVIRTEDSVLIRTKDLTLAAYLITEGFEATMVEIESARVKPGHPQGAWQFEVSESDGGRMDDKIEEFEEGEALVEPIAFQLCLNDTRRKLFEFLGIGQSA
jgi:hypothetical protein